MILDDERPRGRLRHLARELGSSLEEAAWGIVRVANSNMERAIRRISVERGYDPRRFTLVAFGGAGPLHACELAAELRIPRVLIPPHPGVLSALGMVLADLVKDYSRTVMLPAPLRARARDELQAEGLDESDIDLLPALDVRYCGQSYELTIPLTDSGVGFVERFHEAHQRRFSYASEEEPVEVVNLRLTAVGRTAKPRFAPQPVEDLDPRRAQIGHKAVYFVAPELGWVRSFPAALYARERLRPGNMVVGPAIVFQFDTTTVVPPDWVARVDGWGNLVIERVPA